MRQRGGTPPAPGGTLPLRAFFQPRRVAVIGAGRTGGVGAAILRNLASGFTGEAVAVNPHADVVAGRPCYPAITRVPGPVDLAVIAVPRAQAELAVDDCLAKGVPAILMITAGFSETGDPGRAVERALLAKVRAAGSRMIGPNCLGVVNTDPEVGLNASFASATPQTGSVAFASQSGALGIAVLDAAGRMGLGISQFASIGNSADVSAIDLLTLWEADARTRVILLYLESLPEPRRFLAEARRVGRTKPIVALKAGRSAAGARAAASHTGALASGDAHVEALLGEAGVIRAGTLEELFDVGALLARQPAPAGRRVAVLTNAGGPGILAADASGPAGLTIAQLSPATTSALRAFLPPTANLTDPVDMIATASPDDYRRALPLLLADPGVDAVVPMFVPLSVTDTSAVARAIAAASTGTGKPLAATFFGAADAAGLLGEVPCYGFPESAIRALGRAAAYGRWRDTPPDQPLRFDDTRLAALRGVIDACESDGWLAPATVTALLEAADIPTVATEAVPDVDTARAAAARVGYPVVVKGTGPRLLHKTESGAVMTDLEDEAAVGEAVRALLERTDVEQVLVQPMVQGGVEMFIGATFDDAFGHLLVCGGGGTTVELMRDTAQRLVPVGEAGAAAMLGEVRTTRRLRGFRGAPVLDEHGFRRLVLRVSALVDAVPEIRELDLNPVIVTTTGPWVVDARVRVSLPASRG